ncbi:TRAP transporter, DctM subunit [Pseudooceanicola nitratireducens]|jgi:tripartite ATP-independent transporter DctM subunit|uniref:TRAP transporter large permease protein n=1 Tax=Pseudooceanicola nitratireducens TaxID=517719 RepID=A0A1I1P6Q0_9RHOB|nr:TRAP transporter large permease [Pseudooceanicola nitratireducens]SEI63023.1 TRAP transporter, DctM subunit [Pseudooceanicola nitratireducens]SFD02673.1 TRAP transporter, DctM subunit [Pseudooceanicola nitratireducens]
MIASLIAFFALFLQVFLRVPIAFAMIITGTAGFALLRNWDASLRLTGNAAFDTVFSFTLSVIPLFILMGNLLTRSGVSDALFLTAHRSLYRLKGGLAMATIVACGGFSAVCGSSLATAATMSKVAMPSMRKTGYADSLATGAIAAGGTLGILIPPSVILIIYGLITEADIGKLFLAGILPGLFGVVCYIAAVAVTVRLKPGLAPDEAGVAPITRADITGVIAVVGLFAVIMIGIYGGLFTPSEAAAIGALVSLVIAIVRGSLGLRDYLAICFDTARTSAMIFALIIGAEVFSNFVSYAGLPDAILAWVSGLAVGPYVVILALVLVYIVLGAVLESLSMILLTVPIFYPLILSLDFGTGWLADADNVTIWFGILVVVVTEISLISPPIGLNVFVLRSVLRDVPITTMFRGILPFWAADIVRLVAIISVPAIALVLI